MGEGQEKYSKGQGVCDICGRRGWVNIQMIDNVVVAAQCKRCEKEKE